MTRPEPTVASPATERVLADIRAARISQGTDTEFEDTQVAGELATAAACYALPSQPGGPNSPRNQLRACLDKRRFVAGCPWVWPWELEEWTPRPGDRRWELLIAAEMLVAEIERLDRRANASAQIDELLARRRRAAR